MAERRSYPVIAIGEEGDGAIGLADGLRQEAFIPGALPGDVVHKHADGRIELEIRPGPARREKPLCPHFPACGGCRVQHMSDRTYEDWKGGLLWSALSRHSVVAGVEARTDPLFRVPLGSRRRAVLTARPVEAGGWSLGFHEARSHRIVDIVACPVLSPSIVAGLGALKSIAAILAAERDCRLTVLDTGAGLDVAAETGGRLRIGRRLAEISGLAASGRILRLSVDGEPVLMRARPELRIAGVSVMPPPGGFVQAAAEAEAAMTAIALEAVSAARPKRIADLFCGLGTFTLALARRAPVLAVDGERPLVEALAQALRGASGLKPVETKVRDLYRDPLSPRELDAFDAVVLDPPRAGAKGQADALARSQVQTVIAVSCNPDTLGRDLGILIEGGYVLERAAPIDQFLFTPHLEAVAVLAKPQRRATRTIGRRS